MSTRLTDEAALALLPPDGGTVGACTQAGAEQEWPRAEVVALIALRGARRAGRDWCQKGCGMAIYDRGGQLLYVRTVA